MATEGNYVHVHHNAVSSAGVIPHLFRPREEYYPLNPCRPNPVIWYVILLFEDSLLHV